MNDEDLSPLARELIQSGQGAHDPSATDQERILSALHTRIAAGEGQPDPDGSLPPPAPKAPWGLISAGGIGAGLIAAAVAWSSAPETTPAVAPTPAVATPAPAPRAAVPVEPARQPEASAPVEPPRIAPAPSSKPNSRLAEEVEILSRATSALHAGRAEDALTATAEHQRKFPQGLLTEERRSARAQALCLLGRTAEAKRELDHMTPGSPHAARARQRCGLD
jgi:hypothetical protein